MMKSTHKQKQRLPPIHNPSISHHCVLEMIISCTGLNKTEYDTNMCYENGRDEILLHVIGDDADWP